MLPRQRLSAWTLVLLVALSLSSCDLLVRVLDSTIAVHTDHYDRIEDILGAR